MFGYDRVLRELRALRSLVMEVRMTMATQAQVKELFGKLDEEINQIGTDLEALVVRLKTAPDAERDQIADELQASIQKLTDFDSRVVGEEVIPEP